MMIRDMFADDINRKINGEMCIRDSQNAVSVNKE